MKKIQLKISEELSQSLLRSCVCHDGTAGFFAILSYESYEISRWRNQNLDITAKATKFLGAEIRI